MSIGALSTLAQKQNPPISYQELVRDQRQYNGKEVRIEAVWTYGFEWTYLCSAACKDIQKSWVEIANENDLCDGTATKLRNLGKKSDNKALVILSGKLDSGGGYGHMGAYPLRFTIGCIEKFKKIY